MAKVFISYSSKNRDLVKALATDIDELGHEVWFDKELTGGHAWWDSILHAVRACDVFIFALSPQSLDSEACRREYKYAHALNKIIFPVLIVGTVSSNLLPRELSLIQYVDYRQADKAATLKLGRAFTALPSPKALPEPLPEPPAVPVALILELSEQLDSPNQLSLEQQSLLLSQLKDELKDPSTDADALTLLRRFRDRRDVQLREQIDELIQSTQPKSEAAKPIEAERIEVKPNQASLSEPKQEVIAPQKAKNNDSIWQRYATLIIVSGIIWPLVLYLNTLYVRGDLAARVSQYFPWIVQGLLIAFSFRRNEEKNLLWFLRAFIGGGGLAILQSPRLKIWQYILWIILVLALYYGMSLTNSIGLYTFLYHLVNSAQIADYLWFTVVNGLWGFGFAALFCIFYSIARKQTLN